MVDNYLTCCYFICFSKFFFFGFLSDFVRSTTVDIISFTLKFTIFPSEFDSPQVKEDLIFSTTSFLNKLPINFLNNLQSWESRKWKNKIKLRSTHRWVLSVPSRIEFFLIFGYNGQNLWRSSNQSFLILSNFDRLYYLLWSILSLVVCRRRT